MPLLDPASAYINLRRRFSTLPRPAQGGDRRPGEASRVNPPPEAQEGPPEGLKAPTASCPVAAPTAAPATLHPRSWRRSARVAVATAGAWRSNSLAPTRPPAAGERQVRGVNSSPRSVAHPRARPRRRQVAGERKSDGQESAAGVKGEFNRCNQSYNNLTVHE